MRESTILGKYQILEEIGRGGFATVYRARDPVLGREVALKVLDPLLVRDPSLVERFKHEAQTAAVLQHPNLVTIFDLGEAEGRMYIVAELLSGGDLRQRLAKGRLPLPDLVTVVEQIGAALDYAHEQGMVHRDVKPSNILFDARGRAKLSDFGIVKAVSGTQITTTGVALGTPEYMAPEQAEGKPVDGRTDLYALGVMAYEMVTGRVPFTGDTPSVVHYKHVHEPPLSPSAVDPMVPAEVSEVVLKALSKAPSDRYGTAAEFSGALCAAVGSWEQASWGQSLHDVEALVTAGKLDLAEQQLDKLARQRPRDPALEDLHARLQQEQALSASYTQAHDHLQTARDQARRVLAQRPDYPDREGVFEALELRRGRHRQLQETATPSPMPGASLASGGEASQSSVGTTTGGALRHVVAGLDGLGRGHRLALACALLIEVAGLVTSWAIMAFVASWTYERDQNQIILIASASTIALLTGFLGAYLLGRRLKTSGLGNEPHLPAGILPIAAPLAITGVGIALAAGLLERKGWARTTAIVALLLFAILAGVAGVVLGRGSYLYSLEGVGSTRKWLACCDGWAVPIGIAVGAATALYCLSAIAYLLRPSVKAWFEGKPSNYLTDSGEKP